MPFFFFAFAVLARIVATYKATVHSTNVDGILPSHVGQKIFSDMGKNDMAKDRPGVLQGKININNIHYGYIGSSSKKIRCHRAIEPVDISY